MKIITANISGVAKTLNNCANDMYKLKGNFVNTISDLKEAWNGTAANGFFSKIENKYYDLINDAASLTEVYSEYLNGVCKSYQTFNDSFANKNITPGDLS